MTGGEAVVVEGIHPEGNVRLGNERWTVISSDKRFFKGENIRVPRFTVDCKEPCLR